MYYILLGPNKSYKILLRTTQYCCVLQTTTRYLSVLQSTISYYPVLQNTTKTHTLHTQTQAHRAIRQIDAKRPWHGVSPPKWMVYFMQNPIEMDDLGVPLFLETPIYNDRLETPTLWVVQSNYFLPDFSPSPFQLPI